MNRIASALCFVPLVLLFACSSPAPEISRYLLRGAPAGKVVALEAPTRLGIGRVIVAPYLLSGPGLVLEIAPGEVRAARQHQWAEPLDSGLRWFLRSAIGEAFGYEIGGGLIDRVDWDYTIDVYISRLHGTMSGTALLDAAFTVRAKAHPGNIGEVLFSKTTPLGDEGYAALVAAEKRLLTDLAGSIADQLRALEVDDALEANEPLETP